MSHNTSNNNSLDTIHSQSEFVERRGDHAIPKIPHQTIGKSRTGLVLTGGGARAAYQVGALKAISLLTIKQNRRNPFPIICGTSAGAINATVLASYALNPAVGIRSLEKVWANFHVDQIFRSDFSGMVKNAGRWTKSFFAQDYHKRHQLSLLNNTPLKKLLARVVHYQRIQSSIDQKALDAICITASGYTSGQSVSFYQGKPDLLSWKRHRRIGCRCNIKREHLLASSAIPLVFPAVKVNREFFGDGSVRFLSPLSPAIHLGADKILVVGVDPIKDEKERRPKKLVYPTMADIAGHVLDSVFVDSLDSDLERIRRVNRTLDLIPEETRKTKTNLRAIDTLVISPSKDLSLLSGKYFHTLPAIAKFLFRRIGIDDDEGSTVLSYLLFESLYTKELIDLGFSDAMDMSKEIIDFLAE